MTVLMAGVDAQDNVFVAGYTESDLDGNESLGSWDAYLVKLAADSGELMQAAEPEGDVQDE